MFDIHLHLTIPQANDPLVTKLLHDSASFTSFGYGRDPGTTYGTQTAYDILHSVLSLLRAVLKRISNLYLILLLLFTGRSIPVLFSFGMILAKRLVPSSWEAADDRRSRRFIARDDVDRQRHALFEIAGSAVYRQETSLFQIGRHLAPAWEELSKKAKDLRIPIPMDWREGLIVAFDTLLDCRPTLMKVKRLSNYTWLRRQISMVLCPSVGLRLSSINVTDEATDWISDSFSYGLSKEKYRLRATFEGALSALAYCAVVDLLKSQKGRQLVDYDKHRAKRGMCIEAKGLTFTYSGCDAPTLHDINLIVEAGTTLAIVG